MDGFPAFFRHLNPRMDQDSTLLGSWQRSIAAPVTCQGVGVHSGVKVTLTIRPAPEDHGIVFMRTDAPTEHSKIPARYNMVADTKLCTVIRNEAGFSVGTIEHLMSAFAALWIDNALIEIDGAEVPILDGSAAPFVSLLRNAGVVEQNRLRSFIQILKPIRVSDGDKWAALYPAAMPSYSVEISFPSAAIGKQSASLDLSPAHFEQAIAGARTFGFLHEVNYLRAQGLAQGGSLDNAVVVDGDKVLNEGGLRYPDEFARHKVLDAIGDLALSGRPILGAFEASQTGHALNNKLLHAMFADPTAWRYVTALDASMAPAMQAPVLTAMVG